MYTNSLYYQILNRYWLRVFLLRFDIGPFQQRSDWIHKRSGVMYTLPRPPAEPFGIGSPHHSPSLSALLLHWDTTVYLPRLKTSSTGVCIVYTLEDNKHRFLELGYFTQSLCPPKLTFTQPSWNVERTQYVAVWFCIWKGIPGFSFFLSKFCTILYPGLPNGRAFYREWFAGSEAINWFGNDKQKLIFSWLLCL